MQSDPYGSCNKALVFLVYRQHNRKGSGLFSNLVSTVIQSPDNYQHVSIIVLIFLLGPTSDHRNKQHMFFFCVSNLLYFTEAGTWCVHANNNNTEAGTESGSDSDLQKNRNSLGVGLLL